MFITYIYIYSFFVKCYIELFCLCFTKYFLLFVYYMYVRFLFVCVYYPCCNCCCCHICLWRCCFFVVVATDTVVLLASSSSPLQLNMKKQVMNIKFTETKGFLFIYNRSHVSPLHGRRTLVLK